jgi:hypothetical protein
MTAEGHMVLDVSQAFASPYIHYSQLILGSRKLHFCYTDEGCREVWKLSNIWQFG